MALKAGRVGVAPDQVDEFGKINSESTEGYTKQEADAKFETQTHASSTYETKTEAAAKQNINLSVPIELLDGSKLTVESALEGLSEVKNINSQVSFENTLIVNTASRGFNAYTLGNLVIVSYWFKVSTEMTGSNIPVLEFPFSFMVGNYIIAEDTNSVRYGGKLDTDGKHYLSITGPLTVGNFYRTQCVLTKQM